MPDLVITRGLPGSGKTHYALEWLAVEPNSRGRVNRDELRTLLFNKEGVLVFHEENVITKVQQNAVIELLSSGRSVIVDDTHLRAKYINVWYELALKWGAGFEVVDLTEVDLETCIARDLVRAGEGGRYVGETVIRDMARRLASMPAWEPPVKVEPIVIDDPVSHVETVWAAGLFQGEGSIELKMPRLQLKMVDEESVRRFARAVGVGKVYGPYGPYESSMAVRPYWLWLVSGPQCAQVAGLLTPHVGEPWRSKFNNLAPVKGPIDTTWKYEPDTKLPRAWVFDIDGTLAHYTDRSPYEWQRVGEDAVDERVRDILNCKHANGDYVLIVSGRDAECMDVTIKWLSKHKIVWKELFMRPAGDNRNDAVIKMEILRDQIAPRYNVLGVYDDRDRVVAMWRESGLLCCQVAPGNF